MYKPVCYLLLLFILSCCAIRVKRWEKRKLIPQEFSYTIKTGLSVQDTVKVLYTGCGGLVVARGDEAFITDPYYTGHNIFRVLLGCVKIDTTNTYNVLKAIKKANIQPKNITTALIAHAHYDHLEDLPYLMQNKLLSENLNVVGDSSVYRTIKNFNTSTTYSFTDANQYCYDQPPKPVLNQWLKLSEHMRVMIIEANHAPHLFKFSIMNGQTTPETFEHRVNAKDKTNPRAWKRGKTYSYLVDILNEKNSPAFRMFIQSSSCTSPYGFPPQYVLNEKAVDVAFIGVALAQNVSGYPKDILNYLRPQKVVLIHWEDFFRDLYDPTLKKVRGTPMRRFVKQVRKQYNCQKTKDLNEWISMPKPLSLINLTY